MAWYYITFSCGHEGRENIIGPSKNRQWKADRMAKGLCPECYEKDQKAKHAAENEKAAAAAREQELPALIGSLKQILYGETCRQKLIAELETFVERYQLWENGGERFFLNFGFPLDDAPLVIDYMIRTKKTAKWWIERNKDIFGSTKDLLSKLAVEMSAEQKIVEAPKPEPKKELAPAIRPENPRTETVAEIRIVDNLIEVHFDERRDDFRNLVKEVLKMHWNLGRWERKIVTTNGSIEDRAAEVGHRLLAKRFIVRIEDERIREKTISTEYKSEHTKWISKRIGGGYEGWFYIAWDRVNDDYFRVARRITGSRYERPAVVVPPIHFEEVLDFAEKYGFRLSIGAQELVESARAAREQAINASVPEPARITHTVADGKPPVLDTPEGVEIDEEFRDDD